MQKTPVRLIYILFDHSPIARNNALASAPWEGAEGQFTAALFYSTNGSLLQCFAPSRSLAPAQKAE
jgi:hypothetical protein